MWINARGLLIFSHFGYDEKRVGDAIFYLLNQVTVKKFPIILLF